MSPPEPDPPADGPVPTAEGAEEADGTAARLSALQNAPDPAGPWMNAQALQAELDRAVREGLDTVTLTGHVALGETLFVRGMTKSLTIDGAGYTLLLSPAMDEGQRHLLATEPNGIDLRLTLTHLRLQGFGEGRPGGGVAAGSGVDLRLDTCVVTGCAAGEGGGVYNFNNDIALMNSVLTGNTAETGGAVYSFYGNVYAEGPHTELRGNTATGDTGGGALYAAEGNVVLSGARLGENRADAGAGGAVLLPSGGILMAEDAVFTANTAAEGGAIALGEDTAELALTRCSLLTNVATGRGGALLRRGGGLTRLSECRFTANTAAFGGAIFTGSGADDLLEITGCFFRDNRAALDGGAVYTADRITAAHHRPAPVTASRFDRNTAGRSGGALYAPNHAAVFFSGVAFEGNLAERPFAWDSAAPDALFAEEASIYRNNVTNATPSRTADGDDAPRHGNIYNNADVNFPPAAELTLRPWGGRWPDTGAMAERSLVLYAGEYPVPPEPPSRAGYRFGGWRVADGQPDAGLLWSFDRALARTTALDAVWLRADEAAVFVLKPMGGVWGGGGSRNRQLYTRRGSPAYQPDTLSLPGYRFIGWFDQTGGVRRHMGSDSPGEAAVLVARWEALDAAENTGG